MCNPDPLQTVIELARRTLPRSTEQIICGAAAEGRLMLALQKLGDEQVAEAMISRFRQRYPFLKIDYTMGYAVELQPLLEAEATSGRGLHDHFQISSNLNRARSYRDRAILEPFIVSDDESYPAAAKQDGFWYARTRTPVVSIYRKDALDHEERQLVRSYAGLGDARFRDRLGMLDVSAAMTALTAHLLMYEAPGTWDTLAANRPRVRPTGGPLVDGLLAGEYDVAVFGPLGTAVQAVRTGAPIEFVCSTPSPVLYGAFGVIPATAPHPNAARLWADWSTSREGCRLFGSLTGHMSPLVDADKSWVERQAWFEEGADGLRTVDWIRFALMQAEVVARFRRDLTAM